MMKHEAVICASNLSIGYPKSRFQRETILYEHLSFKLHSGEVTCLLGVNGSGKSTLLRTLTGLQKAMKGEVNLNSKNIRTYSESELSTLLGLVLTDRMNVGGLKVRELVGLGRYPYTGFFGKLSNKDTQIINQAMADVGISHKANAYIAELSDGERQKAMIAKVLAQECPIIVLDEPTAFLDIVNRFEIMYLLHQLAIKQHKAILLSTHDIETALLFADRLWLLSEHNGLRTGNTEDIVLSDAINDYLINDKIIFDKDNGRFFPNEQSLKQAFVIANDVILYTWIKNLLHRHGYNIAVNEGEKLKIKVTSANRIDVFDNDNDYTFDSFEKFSNYLRSKK